MLIARQPFCWKWISVTKVSKYGESEYSRALKASYTFQPLKSFWYQLISKSYSLDYEFESTAFSVVVDNNPEVYGFLGFSLSMFLDILIIIFLYSSLHNKRSYEPSKTNAAFWAKRETRTKRKTKGGEKWSACYQSIFLALPPTYAHKYWLTAVMLKGPTKTRSITRKFSPFWLPETATAA